MRKKSSSLFIKAGKTAVVLTAVLSLFACGNGRKPEEDVFKRIDLAVKNADNVQSFSIFKIDSITNSALSDRDADRRFRKLLNASDEWLSTDLSQSIGLLNRATQLADSTSNPRISEIEANLRIASVYNSQGTMLKEASDILSGIKVGELPDSLRYRYYLTAVQLNRSLAERSLDENLKRTYLNTASAYRDSVLKIQPDNSFIAVNKLLESGKYTEALENMRSQDTGSQPFARSMAPYYHLISQIFGHLEMRDSQIYYLALSATADLENGVREYKALPQLAEMIKDDDLDRSYAYINRSMNDAVSSHSQARQNELSGPYREIHASHNALQSQQRYRFILILSALAIITIIIFAALFSLKRKNIKLREYAAIINGSKQELESINIKLKDINSQLQEQSRIKEHYVKSFMELSLRYLAQMEKFRADLAKTAAKGDWKVLTEKINSSRYINREIHDFFNNFDRAFLSIYPSYIKTLNSLLKEEEKYDESSESLSTELRIYALIRLGITESNQIAKFLKCSESTVYNYRTRMRNKAISRDDFEQEFISKREF